MARKPNYAAMFTLRSDGRYQGRWHDAQGVRHTICDRDPERLYQRILEKEKPTQLSFRTMLETWQDKHWQRIREGTRVCYSPACVRALELFGDRPAASIEPAEIYAHLERMKALDYSAKTIKTQRTIYKLAYQNAIVDPVMGKEIRYNPAANVPLPDKMKRPEKREAPDDLMIARIRKYANSAYFGAFPLFLMSTGFRRGEALAVRWRDINFKEETIRCGTQISFSGYAMETEPKTAAGVRTVPMLPDIKAVLKSMKPTEAKPTDFVFPAPSDSSKFMVETTFKRHWNHYCREMGFVTDVPEVRISKQGKRYVVHHYKNTLTPHILRHGYATLLFEADVDVYTAQRLLGHADIETTTRIYTHLREQRKMQSLNNLKEYASKIMSG